MPNPLKILKLKPGGFQFIQQVKVAAPPAKVWKTLLRVDRWWFYTMVQGGKNKLEPWAGGRFYEVAPNGIEALHCTVTYIEPNKLLRLSGPLGMSHLPVLHVFIFELQPDGKGTLLRFCQRTYGNLTPKMKEDFQGGWPALFKELKKIAEGKKSKR
jgi:uncharacterized protein YndB with AHSA1/START domain